MKAKYLIIGGTLVGAIALMSFIKAKTAQAKYVFEKILFKVGFPKNFDISTTRLRFYIDFMLQNPTAQDFTARTGNLIRAKAYRVYRGNEIVAFGDLGNIDGVELPAGGSYTFKNIYVEIPTTDLAKHLLNISGGFASWGNLLKNSFSKNKTDANSTQTFVSTIKANSQQFLKELRYEVDVEGFGQLYTFNKNII